MATLLFTGASGFIGRNILGRLKEDYTRVITLGKSSGNEIESDLSIEVPILPEGIDIVLHVAGKAHIVPRTPEEEQAFYKVNYEGTRNLCTALESHGLPKSFIFLSSVAVYGAECGTLIDENHPLEGSTPYAKSKIMAENYLQQWARKNNVTLTILRPALVAGSNPPGNLGNMVKGIKKGFYLNIAGGTAKKSILHVDDIANLIPLVSPIGGIYNICDSEHPTFADLSRAIALKLGKRSPLSVPYFCAACLAAVGDVLGSRFPIDSARLKKLTHPLTFSNTKAITRLGWTPLNVMANLKF